MPDALLEKMIMGLGVIPTEPSFEINLSRVDETFLDHRIFEIAERDKRMSAAPVWFVFQMECHLTNNIDKLFKSVSIG